MTKSTKTNTMRIVVMNQSHTYELKNGVSRTLPTGWVGLVSGKIAAAIEKAAVGRIDKDREKTVLDADAQVKADADAKAKADAEAKVKADADAKAKADAEAKVKETLTAPT